MSEMTKDLIQQGLAAARVGDVADARRLLRQATHQMPDSIEAWLGLAGVVESLEEKKNCFERVLELAPNNADAKAGLSLVEEKLNHEALAQANTGLGVCYRHPEVETGLRCNRCDKFICPKCAKRTPVGFRCPDCLREQEDKYYTGGNSDYIIAGVIAFPLSLIFAGLFTTILSGFGFFMFFIAIFAAPFLTGIIAEAVRWGVGRRRSRYLRHVVAGCLIFGTAPFVIFPLLNLFFGGNVFGLITPAIFLFMGIATISARLR